MVDLDLCRVVYVRGFTDGLGGVMFADGVSSPTSRLAASRIALALGGRVIGVDEAPWVEVGAPTDVLPPEPALPDPPVASVPSPVRPAAPFLPSQHNPRRR